MGKISAADKMRMHTLHAWAVPWGESHDQDISREAVEAELSAGNLLTLWQDWVSGGSASWQWTMKSACLAETGTLKN